MKNLILLFILIIRISNICFAETSTSELLRKHYQTKNIQIAKKTENINIGFKIFLIFIFTIIFMIIKIKYENFVNKGKKEKKERVFNLYSERKIEEYEKELLELEKNYNIEDFKPKTNEYIEKKAEIIVETNEELELFKRNVLKKGYLMTKTEKYFYNVLKENLEGKEYIIFSKVRLLDLVDIKKQYSNEGLYTLNKIRAKHIDFLITDLKGIPIKRIELDDYSHNSKKAEKGDNIKNNLLKSIDLELIRFKVANYYNFEILNLT